MFSTVFYLASLIASSIIGVPLGASIKSELKFKKATLENVRGKNGGAAYKNQDRCFIETEGCRTCLGVFDGHGSKTGGLIADFVCNNLPNKILKSISLRSEALSACSWMQDKIENEKNPEGQEGGTTAVMGFIEGNKLLVVNVGDSRAVGVLNGKVTQLSHDHKPSYEPERKRVLNAGGFFYNGYVLDRRGHGLAITRTLGDLPAHENNVVIAEPEIAEFRVQKGDQLIFASDGLWDVMGNDEVVNYLKNHTVDQLVHKARSRGSRDDITAIVAIIT